MNQIHISMNQVRFFTPVGLEGFLQLNVWAKFRNVLNDAGFVK